MHVRYHAASSITRTEGTFNLTQPRTRIFSSRTITPFPLPPLTFAFLLFYLCDLPVNSKGTLVHDNASSITFRWQTRVLRASITIRLLYQFHFLKSIFITHDTLYISKQYILSYCFLRINNPNPFISDK